MDREAALFRSFVRILHCGLALWALAGAARAELLIDGDTVALLPGVHASVRAVAARKGKALAFSEGGIALPMGKALRPDGGSVDLWCRLPDDWPAREDRTLFHVGERPHEHVTLFFRNGALIAVYKGGAEHHASLNETRTRRWQPGSWHRMEFSWRGREGEAVEFFLRVDGRLVGIGEGRLLPRWPDRLYVGVRGGQRPWKGLIDDLRIRAEPLPLPELEPGRRTITVDAGRVVGDCYVFWGISNFTSEHMFADPAQRPGLAAQRPKMRQANCVRLLGGRTDGRNRWLLGRGPDGQLRCDFRPMLRYLQGIRDGGWTPRIVLDNVPTALSGDVELHTYGNAHPPKDPWAWHQYVEAAVRAMVRAFGRETVRRWRFRVGTEPDLFPGHWAGTREDYLRHYDVTVDAVTRVLPDADVGPGNILNPAVETVNLASGRPRWGLDIVAHAATGRNYATGATGTRLRHFSCSWYGQVGKPIDSFEVAVRRMRERLDRYPQFRGVPVEVAEFGVLRDARGRRLMGNEATEWGASWYAALAERVYALGVAQVHEWAQTTAGIPHPRIHVITMLERMAGGQRLKVEVDATSHARCGAIACRKGEALYVLLYNHRPMRTPKVAEHVTLRLRDPRLKPGSRWTLSEWAVDESHGVFIPELYRDCEAAGVKPLPAAPLHGGNIRLRFGDAGARVLHQHRATYQGLAALPQTRRAQPLAADSGGIDLEIALPGHSVRLLRIAAP